MKKKYDVIGMTCSACSAHVDKAVRGLDGVDDVNVNLLQNSMTVEFNENKINEKLGLKKTVYPVKNCRNIGKKDMVLNNATPEITVNPETYEVKADGVLLKCEPAKELPLAQRYNLF